MLTIVTDKFGYEQLLLYLNFRASRPESRAGGAVTGNGSDDNFLLSETRAVFYYLYVLYV